MILRHSGMVGGKSIALEEAGAETMGTVIATVKPSDQSEFAAQVDGLVTLGLIRKEENELVLTEQGAALPALPA